jgi:putative drug exporter of the RND superfamily
VLPSVTRGSQANVYVGGATATLQDLAEKIAGRLPIFIAMVVGLSVLLLRAVFRSLWVPLVSAAFNLLSIAAAYGVVVLVSRTQSAPACFAWTARCRSCPSCRSGRR